MEEVTMQELGYLRGWEDGRRIWNGADGRLYHPTRHQEEDAKQLQLIGAVIERGVLNEYEEAYIEAIDDSGAGMFLNGQVWDDREEAYFDNATPTRDVKDIRRRFEQL